VNPHEGIRPNRVGDIVRQVCWDAGVKGCSWDGVSTHALRHTAATDVHRATGDVLAVQAMLGHSSLAVTQVYVQGLNVEQLRTAMEGRSYVA